MVPLLRSLALLLQQPAVGVPRIVVEPDFIASRDGNAPHVEVHVAANPRNRNNLIAGAITHTRPDGTPASKVYYTQDGGLTWSDVSFPEQIRWGGGDPQVGFSETGTGLFVTLTTGPDDAGRNRGLLHAYRSEDGGATWSPGRLLGWSYDHPMLVVDRTRGPFAGRVYVSILYGIDYRLGVFRSSDDGRSYIGPVDFWHGTAIGGNVLPMVVLSDGALVVPFHTFTLDRRDESKPLGGDFFTVLSTDGGVTFSAPRPGPPERSPSMKEMALLRLSGDGGFAADLSPRFTDRIYKAWGQFEAGRWRIMLSISNDRGGSWSDPKTIDNSGPATSQQYLPVVAVNRNGVVGVTWYDTRHAQGPRGYDQYFSASVDGGASFLPPVRVSTETSNPLGSGNFSFTPLIWHFEGDSGAGRISFLSAVGRWVNGGDYSGLAADAEGVFHPFWADSRTGTFLAMTARIRVEGAPETPWPSSPYPPATVDRPATVVEADLTDKIEIIPDPSRYDAATNTLELRLRFKNNSGAPVFGPMTLTIRKFGSGLDDSDASMAPTVLNASSGGTGAGARFDLTPVLGTAGALLPGSTSGAALIRLRLKDPLRTPDAHYLVSGMVKRG